MRNPAINDRMFRSHLHLKLSFHLVEIFIGRPFIFSDKTEASPQASTPQTHQPDRPSRRAALIDGAISAAVDVIGLCKLLHDKKGLARASYTEFSSCRAALLLLLAQSLREYEGKTGEVISLGIRLLKSMAMGNNVSTRSETSVIEAIETAVRKLHSRIAHDASGVVCDELEQESSKAGYERFREWTSLWKMPETDEENVIDGQGWRDTIQSSFYGSGPSGTSSFDSIPGSQIWDTSGISDFGMADIMHAFPQGILGGDLDEWSRWC